MDSFEPTSYTVSVWVKVPSVRAMGIIGRTTSSGINSGVWSHDLHITSAGVFEHYTSTGSSGYTVTGTTVIQPNTWYHVAIVATAGGQELLYVNGASQGTPNSIPSLWMGGDRWQVGTPPPGYNYFNGELGGLAIYHNTALTPAQIAALASGGSSPTGYITANNTQLTQLAATATTYGISFPVNAGMQDQIQLAINSGNIYNFAVTPHVACAGYVAANPYTGNFIESGSATLSTLSGGTIYYSLNGGGYQAYSNEIPVTLTNIQNVAEATNGVVTKTEEEIPGITRGSLPWKALPATGLPNAWSRPAIRIQCLDWSQPTVPPLTRTSTMPFTLEAAGCW